MSGDDLFGRHVDADFARGCRIAAAGDDVRDMVADALGGGGEGRVIYIDGPVIRLGHRGASYSHGQRADHRGNRGTALSDHGTPPKLKSASGSPDHATPARAPLLIGGAEGRQIDAGRIPVVVDDGRRRWFAGTAVDETDARAEVLTSEGHWPFPRNAAFGPFERIEVTFWVCEGPSIDERHVPALVARIIDGGR